MTRSQLRALAERRGIGFEALLADAESKGVRIPNDEE